MRTLIAIAFVFFSVGLFAQKPNLIIEGTTPDLYIIHTVSPKESYYSLSRQYNVPPANIASFNGNNLQAGLKIGQTLKIPLTSENFDQQSNSGASGSLTPVYHVVGKSETLFRIGNNYNKVPLENIKTWNGLSGDNISVGAPLIVGYLHVGNGQLASTNTATAPAATTTAVRPPRTEPQPAPADQTAAEKPAPNGQTNEFKPVVEEKKPVQEPVATAQENTAVTNSQPAQPTATEPVKTTPAPVQNTPAKKNDTPDLLAPSTNATSDEGFFAGSYTADVEDKKEVNATGDVATFKSTSGWQNKKYYVLMNNVEPGTIVKITSGDKSIFAKVLGALPDMKENANLLLRLSNAAASYLGKIDPKFEARISYYQ